MDKQVRIKSIKTGDDGSEIAAVVEGYGVVFGGKDLYNEGFDSNTDFMLDLIPVKPVLYNHGFNNKVKTTLIGRIKDITPDEIGLWVEGEVELHNKYMDGIRQLLDKGMLGWSSGALNYLVKEGKSGIYKSWPIIEFSLTPTPAEPRTLGVEWLKTLKELDPSLEESVQEVESKILQVTYSRGIQLKAKAQILLETWRP